MAQDPISDLQKETERLASENRWRDYKEQAKATRDFHKELYSHQFKEAHGYTQMVVFGGYAAYFAGWGFLKDILDENVIVISALFMTGSVAVFVFSEIYWMWKRSEGFREYAERLNNEPERFAELQAEFDSKNQEVWIKEGNQHAWVLRLTIVPASVALSLFLLGFFHYIYTL